MRKNIKNITNKKMFPIIDDATGILLEIEADTLEEALAKSETIDFETEEKRLQK